MRASAIRVPPAVRHAGRALVLAVVGGALAAAGASTLEEDVTATARVAVSDEVGWPFYSSARDTLLEVARDDAVRRAVLRDISSDDGPVELSAEPTGGEITVELDATAGDRETAIDAADRYATEVVLRGEQDAQEDARQRISELREQIAATSARIDEATSELERLGRESDALGAEPTEAERLVLQNEIEQVQSQLRQDALRRTELRQDLSAQSTALDGIASDFEVVRRAESGGGNVLSDPGTMALLVGLPLFLLGLGLSVLWDQTLGIVRRPEDVRWVTDAPVASVRTRDGEIVDAGPLSRHLVRQRIPGSLWLLVPVGRGDRVDRLTEKLVDAVEVERAGGPSRQPTAPGPAGAEIAPDPAPGDGGSPATSGEPAAEDSDVLTAVDRPSPEEVRRGLFVSRLDGGVIPAAAGGAVVVAVAGGTRLPTIRRTIRDLDVEGLPVEGVVLMRRT